MTSGKEELHEESLPLFVPSLTGCVLVASLVFGCPDVDGAQGGRTADGPWPLRGPNPGPLRVQIGLASWYGRRWQGRPTASGERYDRHQLTAAHRTAPPARRRSSRTGQWVYGPGPDQRPGAPHAPSDPRSLLRGCAAARYGTHGRSAGEGRVSGGLAALCVVPWRARAFQRASSAVEGRNGYLRRCSTITVACPHVATRYGRATQL